jgi:uncharacterized metal-binding protein
MNCADCKEMDCYLGKDCTVIREQAEAENRRPDVAGMMEVAAAIERDGYGTLNRVQEVVRFARMMGYRRLGLAFCIGLAEEARSLRVCFTKEGFRVYSVCCKLCGISKESYGLARLHPDWPEEATCNPVGQALELGRCRTDLNVAVGLCVGHDILFTQHSTAPVTTLIVKDRVLGHHPASALYTSYGRKKLGI